MWFHLFSQKVTPVPHFVDLWSSFLLRYRYHTSYVLTSRFICNYELVNAPCNPFHVLLSQNAIPCTACLPIPLIIVLRNRSGPFGRYVEDLGSGLLSLEEIFSG
ncbi:hypothetical protein NPIL_455201 [Nephila pilipes]|uniref:Uncharacterized protein n=1 Tax=Nephila pilipes TaxID=299642 RepID=A0A8X6Q9C1_NEPPI|nr:hypothetical protein NPIL_455201 [Nephila pilipes]